MLICALIAAIAWNLITWYFGLPSSSSHALIGGLCGAALAAAHGNWHAVIWSKMPELGKHWWTGSGVLFKVVIPMVISPVLGICHRASSSWPCFTFRCKMPAAHRLAHFRPAAIVQFRLHGFQPRHQRRAKNHGHHRPRARRRHQGRHVRPSARLAGILKTTEAAARKNQDIALWIKILCALTMAAGTAIGGWRIIRTLGHKLVKLQPVHGFAAETAGASVLLGTAMMGMPVSTTHVITSSIMGVGAAKRWSALKWSVVEQHRLGVDFYAARQRRHRLRTGETGADCSENLQLVLAQHRCHELDAVKPCKSQIVNHPAFSIGFAEISSIRSIGSRARSDDFRRQFHARRKVLHAVAHFFQRVHLHEFALAATAVVRRQRASRQTSARTEIPCPDIPSASGE